MGVILTIFIYYVVITILGRMVLKRVSVFRLTFPNLLLFIMGATAGTFAVPNLFIYFGHLISKILKHDVIQLGENGASVLIYFLAAVGAATGGIGLVWIKVRLETAPQNKERTTSSR